MTCAHSDVPPTLYNKIPVIILTFWSIVEDGEEVDDTSKTVEYRQEEQTGLERVSLKHMRQNRKLLSVVHCMSTYYATFVQHFATRI